MKLNQSFVKYDMNGKSMVIPLADADFHGVVQGNKTVGVILDCLSQDTTEEEIVSALCDRFDGDPAVIRADVANVIAKLREIGAIE